MIQKFKVELVTDGTFRVDPSDIEDNLKKSPLDDGRIYKVRVFEVTR